MITDQVEEFVCFEGALAIYVNEGMKWTTLVRENIFKSERHVNAHMWMMIEVVILFILRTWNYLSFFQRRMSTVLRVILIMLTYVLSESSRAQFDATSMGLLDA